MTCDRPDVLLLGPVQVRVADRLSQVRGQKQRILLAHLVLGEGQPVHVDRLVSDMWDGAPPRNVGHALQEHVSRLRTTLGIRIDLLEGAGYRLPADQVDTDIRRFTQLSEAARQQLQQGDPAGAIEGFERAFALWRGPALAGLSEVDGLGQHLLHLEERWRTAASQRIDAYLAADQGEAIVAELRTALADDPLRDHSWYQLILALHQTGRRTEAVAAYHEARDVFIDTLGVEPAEYITELHTRLVSGIATPQQDREPARRIGRVREDLVGRGHEMAVLESAWQESRHGLRLVTISGEPGVGKSFLAAEFTRRALSPDTLTLTGHCRPGTTASFQPVEEVLRASLAQAREPGLRATVHRHARGLARIVPGAVEPPSAPGASSANGARDSGDHLDSMDAVAAWLEALTAERPVIVTLEDLHWADAQSVLLLGHLLRSPRTIRALVIVTVRAHQLKDHEADEAAVTDLLRQSPRVTHLPLSRFTEAETTELVLAEAERLSAPVRQDWVVPYVQTASGGNPLFIVELTRHLASLGDRMPERAPPAPSGLRQLIDQHVGALPAPTGSLLREAAVLGTEFAADTLAEVTAVDRGEVDAMLHAAAEATLVEPRGSLTYAFSHDAVRSVLYESLPPLERAELHGRAARVLAAAPHRHNDQVIAHHYRLSDLPDAPARAAEHLLCAGRAALDRDAPTEAAALFGDAVELLGPSGEPAHRCDLLTGLGMAQLRCADEAYRTTLLEATRIAIEIGDPQRLVTAVLANSRGWWSSSVGIDHERVMGVEAALDAARPEDPATRSRLLAMWAQENVRDQSCRAEVLARSEQALEIAEQTADLDTLLNALMSRFAVLYALFEQPAECVGLSRRLLDLAQRSGNRMKVLSGALCLAQASMRFADFQVADRYLDHAEQLARTLQHPSRLWLVSGWQAMREATRGRLDAAQEKAAAVYELGRRTGQEDAGTWFSGQLFTIGLLRGDLHEVLADVDEQVASFAAAIPAWRAAMALALAHAGRSDQATAVLEEFAADDFRRLPQDMLWLNGMCYLSMTCEILERDDIAEQLYRALTPYSGMLANNATIDAGPVDLRLGALARLHGQDDAARVHLGDAAALSRRIDAPLWQAQAERLLAAR